MDRIFEWLAEVEQSAADLYREGASAFAWDEDLAGFLTLLADEETWHGELLRTASAGSSPRHAAPPITVDPETQWNIARLLESARARLAEGALSREWMLETIAAVEFSEWNEIFLYALNLLKGGGREYRLAVMEIERHKAEIESFLASLPGGGRYLETIRRLPDGQGKRILIVENEEATARLLRSALVSVGEVVLAADGEEGLERIGAIPFDVILSDVGMETMDSLDFYQRAVTIDPQVRDRFVFFAGDPGRDLQDLVSGGRAAGLEKPARIDLIRRAVTEVAHKARVLH